MLPRHEFVAANYGFCKGHGPAEFRGDAHLSVALENTGAAVALATKLTLLRASDGERILPVYYSDNYVSLLPGEKRTVETSYPQAQAGAATLSVRGWNVAPGNSPVQ